MNAEKKFEFLEHTADAYVAAYGSSLAEAFENAALAMFEVMTDTSKVKPEIEEEVSVEAEDEQALLYSWLEDLLVRFDVSGRVYSRFKVNELNRNSGGKLRLKAKVWGEPFNPEKHPQKVGVKAITYHRMEIIRQPEGVTVKFILDI
ncbi:archease [Candidatus Bathyarchaeota archaeon]|mgnify:CR=1 FL=1|nr:MAG: archease [Candidatus Bathyarchaeota archaeon]